MGQGAADVSDLLTHQMATVASTGTGPMQQSGFSYGFPRWVSGLHALGPFYSVFPQAINGKVVPRRACQERNRHLNGKLL